MSMTGMHIQMRRRISSPNGRQKHERNMETDTDKGAFVTYSNEAKLRLGVSEKIINEYGVYSKETAAEMARVCREFYDADIGIGVTGTFGNVDPKNKDSAPGEVFFAVSTREGTESFCCEVPEQPSRLYYKLYMANVIVDEINKKVR